MIKAIILNCVEDAEHCVKNRIYDKSLLFSTHSSVDVYLKEKYRIECQCLSNLLSLEEIIKYKKEAFEKSDKILEIIDKNLSPSLNKQFGLEMRYFAPLYSYACKHNLTAYLCFVNSLRNAINNNKIEKLYFYNYQFDGIFFDTNADISRFLTFFEDCESQIIKYRKENKNYEYLSNIKKVKYPNRIRSYLSNTIINTKLKYRKLSNKKNTILIYEPLYDLEFLKVNLDKFNVLYYPNENSKHLINNIEIDFKNYEFLDEKKDLFVKVLLNEIEEDFSNNITEYIKNIILLDEINKNFPISLGIWGNPPIEKMKALIFEYIKSKKIKILGHQHGALYSETLNLQQDGDFNRCDYFISYGFVKEDLERLDKNLGSNINILPIGSSKKIDKKIKKNIDILFPIANSLSMFEGGMMRISPEQLTNRQIILLEFLNSLHNLEIYIKPMLYSDHQNCSILTLLKRLKNLKVVNNLTLIEFIEKYNPKAVIIEFPSQPLYDSLQLDSEIFFMNDPLLPWNKQVLEELLKRVHYSDNPKEIISKIKLLFDGKLEKKRDDTFFNHFVYKENSQENILKLIDDLVISRN